MAHWDPHWVDPFGPLHATISGRSLEEGPLDEMTLKTRREACFMAIVHIFRHHRQATGDNFMTSNQLQSAFFSIFSRKFSNVYGQFPVKFMAERLFTHLFSFVFNPDWSQIKILWTPILFDDVEIDRIRASIPPNWDDTEFDRLWAEFESQQPQKANFSEENVMSTLDGIFRQFGAMLTCTTVFSNFARITERKFAEFAGKRPRTFFLERPHVFLVKDGKNQSDFTITYLPLQDELSQLGPSGLAFPAIAPGDSPDRILDGLVYIFHTQMPQDGSLPLTRLGQLFLDHAKISFLKASSGTLQAFLEQHPHLFRILPSAKPSETRVLHLPTAPAGSELGSGSELAPPINSAPLPPKFRMDVHVVTEVDREALKIICQMFELKWLNPTVQISEVGGAFKKMQANQSFSNFTGRQKIQPFLELFPDTFRVAVEPGSKTSRVTYLPLAQDGDGRQLRPEGGHQVPSADPTLGSTPFPEHRPPATNGGNRDFGPHARKRGPPPPSAFDHSPPPEFQSQPLPFQGAPPRPPKRPRHEAPSSGFRDYKDYLERGGVPPPPPPPPQLSSQPSRYPDHREWDGFDQRRLQPTWREQGHPPPPYQGPPGHGDMGFGAPQDTYVGHSHPDFQNGFGQFAAPPPWPPTQQMQTGGGGYFYGGEQQPGFSHDRRF